MMKRYKTPITMAILLLGCALFIELNFRYWYAFMEQYMMFRTTPEYLTQHLCEVGGMTQYITEFISMAFYYPIAAAAIISVLILLITLCFHRFVKRCGIETSLFRASLPAILLLLFQQESVAHFITLLAATGAAVLYTLPQHKYMQRGVGFLLLTLCYLLAAPANIILAMLILFYELKRSNYSVAAAAVAWSLLLPLLAMNTLYVIPIREAFLSKHLAHPEVAFPVQMWVIGAAYPVWCVVLYLLRQRSLIRSQKWAERAEHITLTLIFVALIIFKQDLMFQPYLYDYYARQGEWEKILSHARHYGVHNYDALIYANLAASHTSKMAESFAYLPQMGLNGLYPRETKYYIQNILSSEVAWQVGHVNTAQRTAFIGTLGSRRSIQPRLMKRLVETYIVTGEMAVAKKFITILESYPRTKAWAQAQRPLLDEQVAASTEWVARKRALMPTTDNLYDMQNSFPNSVEAITKDCPDNMAAAEYLLTLFLSYKDITSFMTYLEPLKGKPLPKLYQEALCIYLISTSNGTPSDEQFAEWALDKAIWNRFITFSRNMHMLTPESAYKMYGDTYYYYLQYSPTPQLPQTTQNEN